MGRPDALLLALALLVGGCGRARVHVAYEIAPPRAPQPTAPPPANDPTPAATREAPPDGEAAPPPTSTPAHPGVPVVVRVESDVPYEVLLTLRDETGAVVAEDRASPDGWGMKEQLRGLPEGRYRLRMTAFPLLDSYPLYDKVIELRRDHPPTFQMGLVRLEVPEQGRYELQRGVMVKVVERPSGRPVVTRRLDELALRTTFGDQIGGWLVLPLGSYTFRLGDASREDQVVLVDEMGDPTDDETVLEVDLTRDEPHVLFDLSQLVALRR